MVMMSGGDDGDDEDDDDDDNEDDDDDDDDAKPAFIVIRYQCNGGAQYGSEGSKRDQCNVDRCDDESDVE